MSLPVRQQQQSQVPAPTAIEDVLIRGDLAKLNEQQRTEYYLRLCHSIGLNPMTQPFQYLTLNGKLVLYARRDCADQLRKINGISIEIVSQEKIDGLLSIHVRAKDRDGRTDEDLGVVPFADTLKGEAAANTILKAVTKAKRRVTLSLSGLGFLDETEVADIPQGAKREVANRPRLGLAASNDEPGTAEADTGELLDPTQVEDMRALIVETGANLGAFLKWANVTRIEEIKAEFFDSCMAAIRRTAQ